MNRKPKPEWTVCSCTREKELELEKEYVARYQRVITSNQIIKLYRSEREFTKLLLRNWKQTKHSSFF